MTDGPARNARVTDRNDLIARVKDGDYSLSLETPVDMAEAWKQIAERWREKFEQLSRDYDATIRDRDYWRGLSKDRAQGKEPRS